MTRSRRDRARSGFTLVELMAALMIGGLVLATASRLLSVLSDGQRWMAEAGERSAGRLDPNAYRWLRRAFESLEVGREGRQGFLGDSTVIEFTSRVPDGRGVSRNRRIRLAAEGDALAHAVDGSPGTPLVTGLLACRFRFLQGVGYTTRMTGWFSPSTAPVAVELLLVWDTGRADTVLFSIGGRS